MEQKSPRQQASYGMSLGGHSGQYVSSPQAKSFCVPKKKKVSMSYKVTMRRTENLSSYSLSKKYLLSPYYGPVSVQVFLWMRLFIWKRDCYPQSTDEEIELHLTAYKQWIQHLKPSSLLQRMYLQLPGTHDFHSKQVVWRNILGSDGGRINNSVFSPAGKNVPAAERVVGLGSDSVL